MVADSKFRDKTLSTFCCILESVEDHRKAKTTFKVTKNNRENVISVRCKIEKGTFMR